MKRTPPAEQYRLIEDSLDRTSTISRIKLGLTRRSGLPWTVRAGDAPGAIVVTAPASRLGREDLMTPADTARLGGLLNLGDVDPAGVELGVRGYLEFIDRAEGRTPRPTSLDSYRAV